MLDTSELHNSAVIARQQIDSLIHNNPDHATMVEQLEQQVDQGVMAPGGGSFGPLGDLPSGDELAAELEKFLRDQGD